MNLRKDHYHTDPRSNTFFENWEGVHGDKFVVHSLLSTQTPHLFTGIDPSDHEIIILDLFEETSQRNNSLQLSAMDVLVPTPMKNAAKCDT